MDTSEIYVRMCRKAVEIQPCLDNEDGVGGTWVSGYILYHTAPMNQLHDRDGYYFVTDERAVRRCEQCGNEEDYIKSSKAIWLPRQDQLQEMIRETQFYLDMARIYNEYTIPAILAHMIMTFTYETDPGGDFHEPSKYASQFTSMEELWLAFTMKERYNKLWNGQDWIKQ